MGREKMGLMPTDDPDRDSEPESSEEEEESDSEPSSEPEYSDSNPDSDELPALEFSSSEGLIERDPDSE